MLLWNGWKVGTGPFSGSFNFPSRVRERLKPEFLVSALMALIAPDFTSCLACSVAVAVSTTGCSDSERLTPPWLAVPLLLCFFRASNAFFFFLSLLNFFCSASSSSLSPGGITNMLAPQPGEGKALPATPRRWLPTPMPNGVRSANLGVRWAEKAAGPAQRYLGNQRRRKKNQGPRGEGAKDVRRSPHLRGRRPGPRSPAPPRGLLRAGSRR